MPGWVMSAGLRYSRCFHIAKSYISRWEKEREGGRWYSNGGEVEVDCSAGGIQRTQKNNWGVRKHKSNRFWRGLCASYPSRHSWFECICQWGFCVCIRFYWVADHLYHHSCIRVLHFLCLLQTSWSAFTYFPENHHTKPINSKAKSLFFCLHCGNRCGRRHRKHNINIIHFKNTLRASRMNWLDWGGNHCNLTKHIIWHDSTIHNHNWDKFYTNVK